MMKVKVIEHSSEKNSSPLTMLHVKKIKQKGRSTKHNLIINISKENANIEDNDINSSEKDKNSDKGKVSKSKPVISSVNNIEQNLTILKQTSKTIEETTTTVIVINNNKSNSRPISPKEDIKTSDSRRLLIKTNSTLNNNSTNHCRNNNNNNHNNTNTVNTNTQNIEDCLTVQENDNNTNQPIQLKINEIRMNMAEIATRNNNFNSQPIQCFICDRFIHTSTMVKAATCTHYFCRKCAKLFYEEKIEQGINILKCPIFKCNSVLSIEFLHSLVSPQHYHGLAGDRNQQNKLRMEINDTIAIQKNLKEKSIEVKTYSQRHVIDINTNETFYIFNQAKDQFCPQCRENSLFSRNGNHFIKCLNCLNSLCKYCLLPYNNTHLDLHSYTHCKVYFRKVNKSFINNQNKGRFFGLQLLLIIVSYLIMFVASFKYNHMFFSKILCLKNYPYIILKIIVYFLAILGFFCSLPIIIVAFPYYPILLEALGS